MTRKILEKKREYRFKKKKRSKVREDNELRE
jgi:hypothetical protein